MTPDLKELERLARAATPGPWFWDSGLIPPDGPGRYSSIYTTDETIIAEFNDCIPKGVHNAEYITYANPAAILSLIAELTRPETTVVSIMRAELEQAKKDVARYRWLVSQPNGGFFHPVFAVNSLLRWKSKAQYDAAIDAAIVKEQS